MLYVDRIENGIAVCEDENGRQLRLTQQQLDGNVCEGDVLIQRGERYRGSRRLTLERRKQLSSLQNRLFGRKQEDQ